MDSPTNDARPEGTRLFRRRGGQHEGHAARAEPGPKTRFIAWAAAARGHGCRGKAVTVAAFIF